MNQQTTLSQKTRLKTTTKVVPRPNRFQPLLFVSTVLLLVTTTLQVTAHSRYLTEHVRVEQSKGEQLFDKYVPIYTKKHFQGGRGSPLRVKSFTNGISGFRTQDPEIYNFIVGLLIPSVTDHLQKTLRAKHPLNVEVAVDDCAEYFIKADEKGQTDADLVLFFTAEATRQDTFVAWAAPCLLSRNDYRPIMGRVNFNPYTLSNERKKLFDQFGTIIHEVYHILGFSSALYKYFIDDSGRKKGEELVITNHGDGIYKHQIISPKVVQHAREHFSCPSLTGVPLEDNGSSGSAGSHWEKTVLGNEFMVANTVANPVVSLFTLRLLEDSGWYTINENMAERFYWGKGQGCGVASGTDGVTGASCYKQNEEGCFYDYTFQAKCTSDQFQNGYGYFTGTDFNSHDCRAPENKDMQTHQGLGEVFGYRSRCFAGDIQYGINRHQNLCYQVQCEGTSAIKISIQSRTYTCSLDGEKVFPKDLNGYVTCPNIKDFCTQLEHSCPEDCSLGGRCMRNGQCYCYHGFSGANCENYSGPTLRYKPDTDGTQYSGGGSGYSSGGGGGSSGGGGGSTEITCPSNCNGRGICVIGFCVCSSGWTGSSCQYPVAYWSPLFGLDARAYAFLVGFVLVYLRFL